MPIEVGSVIEKSGGTGDLFDLASDFSPYAKFAKFALGAGQLGMQAWSTAKQSRAQQGVNQDKLRGLNEAEENLVTATGAKKDVLRSEFGTGIIDAGRQTSYGMEDITGATQAKAEKKGLIQRDVSAEQARRRTTGQYASAIEKQESSFSRGMVSIEDMFNAEKNKIDAQRDTIAADNAKLEQQDEFMETLWQGLVGG